MREILFRGKNASGLWRYGFYAPNEEGNPAIYEGRYCTPVIRETVGQFIGLKDKNGTRIFEGDIVEGTRDNLAVVFFEEDRLRFATGDTPYACAREIDWFVADRLSVVGNIYDDPEIFPEFFEIV